ncbi:papain family cysteine protease domain-containing protein [Ditylenchus destructor]|nr:papain family cysteine protease domain-containing protein [Ditylenchus destructor]
MATATENCEHISDDQVMNLYQLIGPGKWSRFTYDESGCQQMRRCEPRAQFGESSQNFGNFSPFRIVSGSNFTKQEGCKPFTFLPCKYNLNSTAKCVNKCQAGYSRAYDEDKYYGLKAYAVDNNVQAIQNELYKNGPLEISFEVYEDFLNYQGGIYFHKAGKLVGGHAAKLIGWSEENEVPYWTVANSWSTDWGEGGFFRIIRGQDECGIESGVVGGLPDIQRTIEGHRLGHDPKKPLVTTTYD